MGEEPAAGGPTQPGGLGWKTQLHDGTQPSVRHGGNQTVCALSSPHAQHGVHNVEFQCQVRKISLLIF